LGQLIGRDVESVAIFGQFSAQLDGDGSSADFAEKGDNLGVDQALDFPSIYGDNLITWARQKKKKKVSIS